MLEHEIAEFGRRLGFAALALDGDGRIALTMESLGTLHLEVGAPALQGADDEGELLLYVARPVPPSDQEIARRVLTSCSWRRNPALAVAGGIHNDTVILLTRFPARSVTAAQLENVARALMEQADRVIQPL